MIKQAAISYTNGTSALKMPRFVEMPDEATIIAFPKSGHRVPDGTSRENVVSRNSPKKVRNAARYVLESSEMYCSLRNESFKGCPYGIFTNMGITALSTGAVVIGVVSLILGA